MLQVILLQGWDYKALRAFDREIGLEGQTELFYSLQITAKHQVTPLGCIKNR
jgi:hypothetical protein